MDVAAWDANLVEINMQFGKRFKKIKSISSQINLVSRFQIWILKDLTYLKIPNIMALKIIEFGLRKLKMLKKEL